MHLLLKDRLTQEEIKYITKEEELKDAYIKYTSVLLDKEKEVEYVKQKLKREKQKLEKEKERLKKERREKEKALKEKEEERIKKERTQEALINTVKLLLNLNTPFETISKNTGLSIEEIEKISKELK